MKESCLKPIHTTLVVGIVLFCWINARAQPVEDALHFGGGAFVGAAGSFMVSELSVENPRGRISWAVGASLLVGLLKEAVDEYRYNGWDNRDLVFTVLGGLSAGLAIELWRSEKVKETVSYPKHNSRDAPLNEESLYLSGIIYTE